MSVRFRLIWTALFLVLAQSFMPVLPSGVALAQKDPRHEKLVNEANKITVRVVAGEVDDTSTLLAFEMAVVLDAPEQLRVLPLLSGGGEQNIADLLYLDGVDVSIINTDVLNHLESEREYRDAKKRLRYISKLHNEEVYVVAASQIDTMTELSGMPVNFGRKSAGNVSTPQLIFEALGIKVKPLYLDHTEAIAKVAAGELAATVIVSSRPDQLLASLRAEAGLKLVPIEFTEDLQASYLPISLTAEDYPNLIAQGKPVDTLATSVAMVMYNWPRGHARYKRVNRFVNAFFSKFEEFHDTARNAKWKEVNIGASIPGWERFEPAEKLLEEYAERAPEEAAFFRLNASFEVFLQARTNGAEQALSDDQRAEMFRTFLNWSENDTQASVRLHTVSKTGVDKFVGTIAARNTVVVIGGVKERALLLTPDLNGLPPGPHAFRLYSNADCGPAEKDDVMVAGLGAGGFLMAEMNGKTYRSHLGTLPDLIVAEDGSAVEAIIAPRMTLADLLDRSFMVHKDPDEASARLACGVIN